MDRKLIVDINDDYKLERLKKLIKDKGIEIDEVDIQPIDNCNIESDFESAKIIFFLNYDETNEKMNKLAIENNIKKGYNINIVKSAESYAKTPEIFEIITISDINNTIHDIENMSNNIQQRKIIADQTKKIYSSFEKGSGREGLILEITTPKGGTGKTTTTQSLLEVGAQFKAEGKKVLAVDLNISEASFSKRFIESEQPHKRMDVIIKEFARGATGKELEAYVLNAITKEPTFSYSNVKIPNVDILFAPEDGGATCQKVFNTSIFFNILFDILKKHYDLIIVDTSNDRNLSSNLYLKEAAHKIFFVITTDRYSIENTADYILNMKFPIDRYDIFYNAYEEITPNYSFEEVIELEYGVAQDSKEFKKIVEEKVFVIPEIQQIKTANNRTDTVFNEKEGYLSPVERQILVSTYYKALNKNFPTIFKSKDEVKDPRRTQGETKSIFEKILSLFKKQDISGKKITVVKKVKQEDNDE